MTTHENVQFGSHHRNPPVVLVHGVHSSGAWYDTVEIGLAPFFTPVFARYDGFERLGALKVPSLAKPKYIAGLVAAQVVAFTILSLGPLVSVFASTLPLLLWSTASAHQRRKAANEVHKRIQEASRACLPVSAIAHSFGTVLLADTLNNLQTGEVGKTILIGGVVCCHYPWEELVGRSPFVDLKVRNEVNAKDEIARFGVLLQNRVHGMGASGVLGFTVRSGIVCSSVAGDGRCLSCAGADCRVQNIDATSSGHGFYFFTPKYTEEKWLPFLWGLDENDQREFIRRSLSVANSPEDDSVRESLLSFVYKSISPEPLRVQIDRLVASWPNPPRRNSPKYHEVHMVFTMALGSVVSRSIERRLSLTARSARTSAVNAPDHNIMSWLHPLNALKVANMLARKRLGRL